MKNKADSLIKKTIVCVAAAIFVLCNAGISGKIPGVSVSMVNKVYAAQENVTGKSSEALQIKTYNDLLEASTHTDGSYILMSDIDMSRAGADGWKPWNFNGTFDGNGHTLYNMDIHTVTDITAKTYDGNLKEYDTYFAGFFGITDGAVISNLNITGAYIELGEQQEQTQKSIFAAVLAGYMNNTTISNCKVEASYAALTSASKMWGTAGIAGFGNGLIENTTSDVTLVCTDADPDVTDRDEQFMGGAYAAGFLNIRNCKINIDGYDSDHGYVHDGGLVGMYMVYPYDLSLTYAGEVLNNEVYGQITFYEDNTDRRAYCKANMGEVMNWTYAYSGFKYDFDANETFDYSVTLLPEKCDNPVYNDTVTEPTVTDFGFTTHTCQGCGYTYNDKYTIYKEYKDDSEEVTSPDNDMNMSDDSFGVTKKKDNHVIHVLVVILLTVVMILLIVRYIQVRNQRKRRRRHRRR